MMHRRIKITFFLAVALIVMSGMVLLMFPQLVPFLHKKHVMIAVVGPMSGPDKVNGDIMLRGIQICLEQLRKEGKLQDKRIILQHWDDQSDERRAVEVAMQIAQENKVLLVLGHLYSGTSIAAGRIYKRAGIPAITGTATAEAVTQDNEWYFRTISTNRFQAEFVANYIKNVLQQNTASLLVDNEEYGISLAKSFEATARKIGLRIRKKWNFNPKSPALDNILPRISAEVQSCPDPGVLFFAMYPSEAAKILTLIHQEGKSYTIIGPDSFSANGLVTELNRYPQEQQMPGYYSDGIYVLSPLIIDIANETAQKFKRAFVSKYHDEPTWDAACYYDAMLVAAEAIAQSDLQGEGHIRSDRRKILQALRNIASPDVAVKGTTEIYFDSKGDISRPFAVEILEGQVPLPAFTQYQILPDLTSVENPFESALLGDLILVNEQVMQRVQIVRTGIHIHEVNLLDRNHSLYTLDFFLWFRFQHDVDVTNISFVNAVAPIHLDAPIIEETTDQITTQVYRIKAEFKGAFDFHRYPFDTQVMPVVFRHAALTRDHLLYVPDPGKLSESLRQQVRYVASPKVTPGWKIVDISRYQTVASNISTLGNPKFFNKAHRITSSLFNVDIRIARASPSVVIIEWAPILVMIVVLGVVMCLPSDLPGVRVGLCMGLLLFTAGLHFKLLVQLPVEYLTFLEYGLFAMYGLLIFVTFMAISAYAFYRRRLVLLQGIDLFRPLSDKIKSALSKKMRRRRLKKPGQTVIRQGKRGDSLFVVIAGEVGVWITLEDGNIIEVERMKAGDFFGEMALLTGEPRSATIISSTPAFLGEITKTHLAPFLKKHPELVQAMSSALIQRTLNCKSREEQFQVTQVDQTKLVTELSHKIEAFFGSIEDPFKESGEQ